MSQPHPTQQQGFSNMQLWQHHLMYKQLEMQRQGQLRQQSLGGRQPNTPGHLSAVSRHAGIMQSPPLLSGMPINCPSDHSWSRELMGAESKETNSSHEFQSMNWAEHVQPQVHGNNTMFSRDQDQATHPIEFVQQHDHLQSLYGTPVSSTRYLQNQYPQFQGLLTGGNSAKIVPGQPSAFNYLQNDQHVTIEHSYVQDDIPGAKQSLQGNSSFGYAPVQFSHKGAMLGNFQQRVHYPQTVQSQEVQDGKERDNWSHNLQVKKALQVAPSRSIANLDSPEAKLSYTDNDGYCDGSFGDSTITNTGNNNHANLQQNNDHSSSFPSIQSGSWSALMLDALEVSSSDTGLQEEWSSLSFVNEPSTKNHFALLNHNGNQQLHWDEKNTPSASSLTSSSQPLVHIADVSPNHHSFASCQQSSTKVAYEEDENLSTDITHGSSQHSFKEGTEKQFNQYQQRNQLGQCSLQEQTSSDNVSTGLWAGQMPLSRLTDVERHPQVTYESHSGYTAPNYHPALSYDGFATHFTQNNNVGQASHNIPELRHKVHQSKKHNSDFSDHSEVYEMSKDFASNGSAYLQHGHSSSPQGFGLNFIQPSPMQLIPDNDLASQASSTTSVPSLPVTNQESLAKFSNGSNIYGHMNNETSHSGTEANPWAFTTSSYPNASGCSAILQEQHHHQRNHDSGVTESLLMDQYSNPFVGVQADVDAHVNYSSRHRHAQGLIDGKVYAQLTQESLSGVACRFPSSRLNPSRDTCAPANPSAPPSTSCQQLPAVEARSAAQPSTIPGMSQQGGFSSMLHKVCSGLSAQQHLSIVQAKKIISQLPQSIGASRNTNVDTMSWVQKANDQCSKIGGSVPSEDIACSTNSQQLICAADYPMKGESSQYSPTEGADHAPMSCGASQGQQPDFTSSLLHLNQQELNGRKYMQKRNYSHLQQVQAMKRSDSDPSSRAEKRLKGEDFVADAPHVGLAAGQMFNYEGNTLFSEFDADPQHNSLPLDINMLRFSRQNEDECSDTSSQLIGGGKLSNDLLTSRHNTIQNHSQYLNITSTLPQINSQMGPSFEQYMSYINGQVGATYAGTENSQSSVKATAYPYPIAHLCENKDTAGVVGHTDVATQSGIVPQDTLIMSLAANKNLYSHGESANVINDDVVLIPRKHKTATSELLPWHKKPSQGSKGLPSISLSDLGWAKATNRLVEKVEDESEMVVSNSPPSQPRRRLALTTHLMQQLLPSGSATFLRADAFTSYESMTCFVAKLSLEDAFNVIYCSGCGTSALSNSENTVSQKRKSSEEVRFHVHSKKMEGFVGRMRKLESDLLRLDVKDSMVDVMVDFHDLDRCSIITRLAKFHGRSQIDTIARVNPQRHVIAHAVNADPPRDVPCLSL